MLGNDTLSCCTKIHSKISMLENVVFIFQICLNSGPFMAFNVVAVFSLGFEFSFKNGYSHTVQSVLSLTICNADNVNTCAYILDNGPFT